MTGDRSKPSIHDARDTRKPLPELRALTGLRFLAAFHVLVFHALFTFSRLSVHLPRGAVRSFLGSGYVGVNLFFVLSGFVLAYAYVHVSDGHGAMTTTARRFWWARFARIYPLHLLGVLLALPLFALGSSEAHATTAAIASEGAKEVALSALLVQAWVPSHALDLNGPSWSLSVEVFFYALFPLLVRLLGRLRERGLGVVALTAWLAAVVPPLLHPVGTLGRSTTLDLVLLYDPLVRLPDFVIGVVTGFLFLRAVQSHPTRPARDWPRARVIATATFLLILSLLATSDHLPFALVHNGLLDPLWALLVVTLAIGERSERGKRDPRGLASEPLVRGGRASYALYVLHKPVYFWLAKLLNVGLLPSTGFLAGYLGGSVALAVAAWRYIEEPARAALRRRK